MQPKWTYFTIGIMAGVIAVLATVLLLQPKEAKAYTPSLQDSAQQAGILMSPGGSQPNQNDLIWVGFKRHVEPRGGAGTGADKDITKKDERVTLCCYQFQNKKFHLVGVRDISFDMDLLEWDNEPPKVTDVVKALKEQQKKEEKK